jgi:hypothetical protein
METFQNFLLGDMTPAMFAAALFFALVGVIINLLLDATTRKPDSLDTPVRFSWQFLCIDNWKRTLLSLLLILVFIRFSQELTGLKPGMFVSLLVGFLFDKLSEFFKSKSDVLKINRQNLYP